MGNEQNKGRPEAEQVRNGSNSSSELDKLKAELAIANAKVEAAELKAEELKIALAKAPDFDLSDSGLLREDSTTRTKPTWMFKVSVLGRKEENLPAKEIRAVDESEAIRLYCLRALGNGKALDTVRYQFKVECLDPARLEKLKAAYAKDPNREYVPSFN